MTAPVQAAAPASTDGGAAPLPPPTGLLRRAFKHPLLMHYNRLVALVWAVNLAALWIGLRGGDGDGVTARSVSHAALANLALAVVVRQQYVINALFWLATRAPTNWPLRVRWTLGKVYHFGGLHVGGATAGVAWFLALPPLLVVEGDGAPGDVVAVSSVLAALLVTMVVTALPPLRARHHDLFERAHRFGGWGVLLLFWVQTVLVVGDRGEAPWAAPESWVLAVVTFSVALPWLRLRKVDVAIERPSAHVALARFDHGVTPFAGSSTAISRSPLTEWHSFANVPSPGRSGFRLTISRAGDWTASFIDDAPARVWVKGITTAGVANIETLFRRVVYIATGSGIGPCLPHLLARQVPARLVWATRTPERTYGEALVAEIRAVQPGAVIWDTSEHGKPDLVALAYAAYRDFGAEAVICISNKATTWRVVHGLERRGIPAYGAIWDS
ncbi:hypothetical protein ACTWP5_03705 [Streptomyces sp. 4N509B]|uniref:hypothetical protein n=1 Tax=Streptomyces sp. 4N509B TaxID=3457413 RepID=UPI003FD48EA7